MDYSEEYIEMCRKSKKYLLKADTYFRIGAMFIYNDSNIFPIAWSGVWPELLSSKSVPIWQQDQLQSIINVRGLDKPSAWSINSAFTAFLNVWNVYSPIEKSNMSMEQLWLAFIMNENFNKKWSGKDWV